MQTTIVGCAGSFPGPESAASCYLIDTSDFRLVLDMGNGSLGSLQRYVDIYSVDAVCVSHLHSDHCLDLCSYSTARIYHPDGPRPQIPVYAPAGAAERMTRALGLNPGTGMTDAFEFVELGQGTIEIGPLRVTAATMNHSVETFGFRIEHGGKVLAYSADTGPTPELVRIAADADALLCEASFLDGPGLPGNVHLTSRQAAEHAALAGVGELVLTHLVAWNDPRVTLEQATGIFSGPMWLASPGLTLL